MPNRAAATIRFPLASLRAPAGPHSHTRTHTNSPAACAPPFVQKYGLFSNAKIDKEVSPMKDAKQRR